MLPQSTHDVATREIPTDHSPSRDSPIKVQDRIKSDLIEIARSRNIHVPGMLDPRNDVQISRLPRAVQALYLTPMRRPVTHGHPVANLQLRSYSIRNLEFMADFALRAAYYLNLPAKGPVPLPRITERWTVPKSNFVHKKSQENWERVTTRRLVQVLDGDPEVVRRWLAYMRKHCWYGVGMKADVFQWEDMNVTERMDAAAEKAGDASQKVRWELFGRRKGETGKADIDKLLDDSGFGSSQPAVTTPKKQAAAKEAPPKKTPGRKKKTVEATT